MDLLFCIGVLFSIVIRTAGRQSTYIGIPETTSILSILRKKRNYFDKYKAFSSFFHFMQKNRSKADKYKLGKIDLSMKQWSVGNRVVNLLSGMGAGPTSDFALFPLDSMKTYFSSFVLWGVRRLQASKGSVKVAKNSKLFLGFGIAMAGSSLTYGTHWMIYEYFKRHLTPLVNGNETLIPFVYMTSASMGTEMASHSSHE